MPAIAGVSRTAHQRPGCDRACAVQADTVAAMRALWLATRTVAAAAASGGGVLAVVTTARQTGLESLSVRSPIVQVDPSAVAVLVAAVVASLCCIGLLNRRTAGNEPPTAGWFAARAVMVPLSAWCLWYLWHGYYTWVSAMTLRPSGDGPTGTIRDALVSIAEPMPAAILASMALTAAAMMIAYGSNALRSARHARRDGRP